MWLRGIINIYLYSMKPLWWSGFVLKLWFKRAFKVVIFTWGIMSLQWWWEKEIYVIHSSTSLANLRDLGDRMWERTTSPRKWQIWCVSDIFVAPSSCTVDTGFVFCFMKHFIRRKDVDCSYTIGDISSESWIQDSNVNPTSERGPMCPGPSQVDADKSSSMEGRTKHVFFLAQQLESHPTWVTAVYTGGGGSRPRCLVLHLRLLGAGPDEGICV